MGNNRFNCSHKLHSFIFRAKGPLSPARPHAQRARHAALHRESTVIYRCSRQGATPNTRALDGRNQRTPLSTFYNLSQSLSIVQFRAKGSLSPARPHKQRAGDAALHRSAVAIYRCFRQGVTPNTRAPG